MTRRRLIMILIPASVLFILAVALPVCLAGVSDLLRNYILLNRQACRPKSTTTQVASTTAPSPPPLHPPRPLLRLDPPAKSVSTRPSFTSSIKIPLAALPSLPNRALRSIRMYILSTWSTLTRLRCELVPSRAVLTRQRQVQGRWQDGHLLLLRRNLGAGKVSFPSHVPTDTAGRMPTLSTRLAFAAELNCLAPAARQATTRWPTGTNGGWISIRLAAWPT